MPTLEDIYDEHVWRIYAFFAYRLGSREDAEDLTQATFERAAKAFHRFDPGRAAPLTWLMAIANNLLIDHFRRGHGRRQTPFEEEQLEQLAPAVAGPEEDLGLSPEIAAALALLSERDRQVVALRYGADLTSAEIGELLELSVANVQQILSRSLRRMRAAIEEGRVTL